MQDSRTINDAFMKIGGCGDKVNWRWLDTSAGAEGIWKPITATQMVGRVRYHWRRG